MYFPGLGWADLTTRLRQTDPVTVTRGRGGEQGDVAPTTFSATLKNQDGNMSPGNVAGPYYGLLGRNTPVQWGFGVVRDTFTRTVVDGLGSATTGEPWTLDGTAANFDVNGSAATILVPTANATRHAYLTYLEPFADYEVTVDVTIPYPNGASNSGGVIFRGTTTSNFCRLSLTVSDTGLVTLNMANSGGSTVDDVITVDTTSAGTYRVRALVEGQTVRGKAWRVADPVPLAWQVEGNFGSGMLTAGWAGIRARSGTGSSNVTITVDNFTVRLIRFSGEVTSLEPKWSEGHKVKWAELVASGVTQRLGQGKTTLKSALRRYITKVWPFEPLAYWALDDKQNAEAGRLTAGAGQDAQYANGFENLSPARVCGKGDLGVWNGSAASFQAPTSVFQLFPQLVEGPASSGWTSHCAASFDGVTVDGANNYEDFGVTSASGFWAAKLDSSSGTVELSRPNGGTATASAGSMFDGRPHLLSLTVAQSGADCIGSFYLDGNLVTSITQTSLTNTYPSSIFFNVIGVEARRRSPGHVILYAGSGPAHADLYAALLGWPGETAGNRIQRLCEEEGVPFDYLGTLNSTAPMGPQYADDTFLEVIRECAKTDQGSLFEQRSLAGLGYRPLESTQNQTAIASLDYVAKQLAPGLRPSTDDRPTRNLITAKRRDGGEFVAEQTAGPMNTADPGSIEGAVGVIDDDLDVNPENDAALQDIAWRAVSFGTVPDDRYRQVTVNLRSAGVANSTALTAALLTLDTDDRFQLTNMQAIDVHDPVDQIARGYTESCPDSRQHTITFNTAPYTPYRVFVLDTDRLDSDTASLAANVAAGQALPYTISVADSAVLWTTAAGDFPLDIVIAGQRLTISGISGASSPQTFTVSARANGVDKAQVAGAKVSLADSTVLG
jgi:hypothetical protein